MLNLHFICPECLEPFHIDGWWKWIWKAPFHWFSRRYTKCPNPKCSKRSWMAWYAITRD